MTFQSPTTGTRHNINKNSMQSIPMAMVKIVSCVTNIWYEVMKICCLMTFPAIFQLYRSSHFIGIWRKTSNLSQVADKLYYIMLYGVHLAMSAICTHNFSGDRH
jgi:hypothetical protein